MLLGATVLDSASLVNEILSESHCMQGIWRLWNLKQVGLANLGGKRNMSCLHDNRV